MLNSTKKTMERTGFQDDQTLTELFHPSKLLATYPVTCAITLCTLILHLELWIGTPRILSSLQLQLDPVHLIQSLPRVITGNFTHWTTGHLLTDLSAFFILGLLYERGESFSFLAATLLGATATSLAVLIYQPDVSVYRGLSGVNHGLLAYGILSGIRQGNRRDTWMGMLFSMKLLWEVTTGILVLPTGGTFSRAFAEYSHAGGAVGGTIVFLFISLLPGTGRELEEKPDRNVISFTPEIRKSGRPAVEVIETKKCSSLDELKFTRTRHFQQPSG